MKIALDLDGVLIDTMGKFVEIWNLLKKDNKTKDDIKRFGFYEDWGMNTEEFWAMFDFVKHEKIDPVDSKVAKYVKKIKEKYTYSLDVVTTRKESERGLIERHLNDIGLVPGTHYDDIIITPRLGEVPKSAYPYDLFIDDSPYLAKDIQRFAPDGPVVLLWQQPWNWMVESGNNVYRVTNWKQVLKCFENNKLYK